MTSNDLRTDELKALELLPWYVNGTLEGEERELVGRHVLSNLTCRKEFERLTHLHRLIQSDDAEAAATGRAFERLMARIAASGASDQPRPARSRRKPAQIRLALAASLTAAVSALLWWWWDATPSLAPHVYETMTRPQSGDPEARRLRVVFAPGVSESEREDLLARHRVSVIGSPTADGIVTLALAEDANPATVVAALKRDPRIRLVTTPPAGDGP